jgi:hypothetical protein
LKYEITEIIFIFNKNGVCAHIIQMPLNI